MHFNIVGVYLFFNFYTKYCINKLLLMKNLKKLPKSALKKINGGNAPECPEGTTACYIPPKNGFPSRWRCVLNTMECPD